MKDILIIGGGIAGISAAAALAPFAKVTLLEAESALGYHTSGRSAAMYLADFGNPVVQALNRASYEGLKHVLSPRGMLLLGSAQDEVAFREESLGFGMAEISVAEAMARLPILDPAQVCFAAARDDVFDLDTDRLLQGYARTARRHGAALVNKARVEALTQSGAGWEVVSSAGRFQADMIINAAGAWADGVAKLAGVVPLGIQPYRRTMARLPAPEGQDVRHWPFTISVGERWYAKPDAGSWLVSPADEDRVAPHDAWADDMVLAEGLARYGEMVTAPVTRLQASWAGLRSFAPDKTLVIGPDKAVPSFFWLAGQGGYGFQTAPAASKLVADLILGRGPDLEPEVVAALGPQRF
jgi:glycine/D-amino acid oxidase-like deaminating enzyme